MWGGEEWGERDRERGIGGGVVSGVRGLVGGGVRGVRGWRRGGKG